MDFVVAGLGLGALIVVVGFVIRDLGPILWRARGGRRSNEEGQEERLWVGLCQSISVVLTFAGVAILIATVLAVALGFSDDLGARVVVVVSVVSVLAAIGLLALNIRDYRKESFLLASTGGKTLRSSGRPLPTSLSSQAHSGASQPFKPARKPVETVSAPEVVAQAPIPAPEEYDPHLDEPFDATKLLATEFDHHDSENDLEMFAPPKPAATTESEPADFVKPESEIDDSQDDKPATDLIIFPVPNLPEVAVSPDFKIAPATAEDTVISTMFRSPLLADISGSGNTATGSFESKLLADVDISADDHADDFVSPLFADLDGAVEANGSETDGDDEVVSEESTEESRQETTATKQN